MKKVRIINMESNYIPMFKNGRFLVSISLSSFQATRYHRGSKRTTPGSLKVSIPKNSNLTFTENNFFELKQLPCHFHEK